MCAYRKTVRFVPKTLQIIKRRRFHGQGKHLPPIHMKRLASGITVRPFCNRNKRDAAQDTELFERLRHGGELPLPPINNHQIRPLQFWVLRQTRKTTLQDFPHHTKIIPGRELCIFDVKSPVVAFLKTFRPCHNKSANRMRALNMAIIIDFNALRELFHSE